MTLPRYGPPESATPIARSGLLTAVKVAVVLALVCAGLGGALVVGAIGYIVLTGCFLECSGANPVGGALLGLLALGLLVGLPWLAAVMWRTARTWREVRVWAGLVLGGPALLYCLGIAQSVL